MLVVAFILTALAGVLVGIWLFARAANSQLPANPTRMWAFIDVMKQKTIEAYAAELSNAIKLKFPDVQEVPVDDVSDFIDEYTASVLEHAVTRR